MNQQKNATETRIEHDDDLVVMDWRDSNAEDVINRKNMATCTADTAWK